MKTATKFSPEVRERAVRLVQEHPGEHESQKAEVIHRQSWKNREAVELATLTWVDGFNHRRLFEPLGHKPPAEAEAAYYEHLTESALAA